MSAGLCSLEAHPTPDMDQQFKLGMSQLASGVSIVTAFHEGAAQGLMATSVSSLSIAPPSLLVCVNKNASAYSAISASGAFCINVLADGDQEIAAPFASATRRSDRFISDRWTTLSSGSPALSGALANFDCSVLQEVSYSSHSVFFGSVKYVSIDKGDSMPLLYFRKGFANLLQGAF